MREADTLRLYDYLRGYTPTTKSQVPTSNSQLCAGHIPCIDMEHLDWRPAQKPYDLRERLFEFACLIVRVAQFLHTRGSIAVALSDQLLRCGTSAGANYEEADDGSSDRDSTAKKRITLRELKEARFHRHKERGSESQSARTIQTKVRSDWESEFGGWELGVGI